MTSTSVIFVVRFELGMRMSCSTLTWSGAALPMVVRG
jgi:hypothetical protein